MAGVCFGPLGLIYAAVLSSQVHEEQRKGYVAHAWGGAITQLAILAIAVWILSP